VSKRLQLYREGIEAWNRGDLEWFKDRQVDDFETRPLSGIPGLDEVYFGPEGWAEFWKDWRDAWETVTIEADRVEAIGEKSVRARITFDGVGKGSGVEVNLVAIHLVVFDEQDRFTSSLTFWPDEAKRRWPEITV
jgi:hypothetical protein